MIFEDDCLYHQHPEEMPFKGDGVGQGGTEELFRGEVRWGELTGADAYRPAFVEAFFGSKTGKGSTEPGFFISEWGRGVYAGGSAYESEKPSIYGGYFNNYTALFSSKPLVIGDKFGRNTLFGSEDIMAYIPKAESICHPKTGTIIARDVKKIDLTTHRDEFTDLTIEPEVTVYTTQPENVKKGSRSEVFFINSDDLREIVTDFPREENWKRWVFEDKKTDWETYEPTIFEVLQESAAPKQIGAYRERGEDVFDSVVQKVEERACRV